MLSLRRPDPGAKSAKGPTQMNTDGVLCVAACSGNVAEWAHRGEVRALSDYVKEPALAGLTSPLCAAEAADSAASKASAPCAVCRGGYQVMGDAPAHAAFGASGAMRPAAMLYHRGAGDGAFGLQNIQFARSAALAMHWSRPALVKIAGGVFVACDDNPVSTLLVGAESGIRSLVGSATAKAERGEFAPHRAAAAAKKGATSDQAIVAFRQLILDGLLAPVVSGLDQREPSHLQLLAEVSVLALEIALARLDRLSWGNCREDHRGQRVVAQGHRHGGYPHRHVTPDG